MKLFGLTGNIGCGKSTVASLLSQYEDVLVLDCDNISKELILDEKHREQIMNILGENVFSGEGTFKRIAKIIFNDPQKKKAFEEFVHPLVWKKADQLISSSRDKEIFVVEAAIIFEKGSENKFSSIIVATCNQTEQFRRLRENRHMTDEQIIARVKQQLPSFEKEKRAQFVIHTDCSMEELKQRVNNLYQELKTQNKL